MAEKRYPMTPAGKKAIEERLRYLKTVERPQNIKAIEIARGHGDLSENADYDAAKNHQGILHAQINDLEQKLSLSQVIDPATITSDKIVFGATVKVCDIDSEEELNYMIVGLDEADIAQGKISVESPIARALIGKSVGDEAVLHTPKGARHLEILKIEYK